MTTIACRDYTIACDSFQELTIHEDVGSYASNMKKIIVSPDARIAIAITGLIPHLKMPKIFEDIDKLIHQLSDGNVEESSIKAVAEHKVAFIALTREHMFVHTEVCSFRHLMDHEYIAIGEGTIYAMTAMGGGLSAENAVGVAKKVSGLTGGDITTISAHQLKPFYKTTAKKKK